MRKKNPRKHALIKRSPSTPNSMLDGGHRVERNGRAKKKAPNSSATHMHLSNIDHGVLKGSVQKRVVQKREGPFFCNHQLAHRRCHGNPLGSVRSNADGITFQEKLRGHCYCHGNPLGIVQALIGGHLIEFAGNRSGRRDGYKMTFAVPRTSSYSPPAFLSPRTL